LHILIVHCSISDSDLLNPDSGFVLIPDPDVCQDQKYGEKKNLVGKKCNVNFFFIVMKNLIKAYSAQERKVALQKKKITSFSLL
jgi:hypothetical protein